jgi:hypothetical protein
MHGLFVQLMGKRQTSVSGDASRDFAAPIPAAKSILRCNMSGTKFAAKLLAAD